MVPSRQGSLAAGLAATLLFSAVSAYGQDADRARRPFFRGGVRVLEVDVIVTDEDGRFVPDLRIEDFELYHNEELQEITSLRSIELADPTPPVRIAGADADVLPPRADYGVVTNEGAESGRLFVLVLDDLHVASRRSARVRELATGFLERSLGPHDLVSVAFTSGLSRPFSSNRTAMLATVDRFMGRMLRSSTLERLDAQARAGQTPDLVDMYVTPPSEIERGRRNLDTMKFLRAQCEFLETIRGRRKALIWVSEGLDYDVTNVSGKLYATSLLAELSNILDRAARANVAIYAIDPRGLSSIGDDIIQMGSGPSGVPTVGVNSSVYAPGAAFAAEDASLGVASLFADRASALRSLRRISELTGGRAFVQNNDLEASLARVVRDTSRYYLLGFSPPLEGEPGDFKRIEVRVKREGVDVRARHGWAVAHDERTQPANVWGSTAGAPALREALARPVPVTGLVMRVAAAPMGQDGESAVVPVVVWSAVDSFVFEERDGRAHDSVEVWMGAFRQDGELADSYTRRIALAVPIHARGRLAEDGFRAMGVLRLAPGTYQLRVALHESGAARTGSVLVELDVAEPKESLLRGFTLSSTMESRIPVAGYDREDPVLPTPPVTTRAFERADELIAYVELTNPDEKECILVLDIHTPDGRSVSQVMGPAPKSDGKSVVVVSRRIALSTLEPGDYQMAFRAVDADGEELAVRRTLFSVH